MGVDHLYILAGGTFSIVKHNRLELRLLVLAALLDASVDMPCMPTQRVTGQAVYLDCYVTRTRIFGTICLKSRVGNVVPVSFLF